MPLKFLLNANGYTNILKASANPVASATAANASPIPIIKNSIFTAIKKINPSKLKPKIIPGIEKTDN